MNIAILNYGVGNIFSLKKAFETVSRKDVAILKILDKRIIESLDILILPGVGHFSKASSHLFKYKDLIVEAVDKGLGLFGICLGMQLLGISSEEGPGYGLGIMDAESRILPSHVKLPHMGWNTVELKSRDEFFTDIKDNSYFYFAHSYYLSLKNSDLVVGETSYGIFFPSAIRMGLIVGVQFHPEKSGDSGLRLISNYVDMVRR